MAQSHVLKLPEEIMVTIFSLLPPQDLKSVMLVCKSWMSMGEDPSLWTWVGLVIRRREEFHKLRVRRFKFLDQLEVDEDCECQLSSWCLWEEVGRDLEDTWINLFEMIVEMPRLRSIYGLGLHCCWTNFHSVGLDLMLDIFQRLRSTELNYKFTEEQSNHIVTAIAENKCSLNILHICHDPNTINISPLVFGAALSNVEDVLLDATLTNCCVLLYTTKVQTTKVQMVALFTEIVDNERPISNLELRGLFGFMHRFEPELVGKAFNRLRMVTLENTYLSKKQIVAILQRVVEPDSNLHRLHLGVVARHEIEDIDPDLVRLVEKKIGTFYEYYFFDGF